MLRFILLLFISTMAMGEDNWVITHLKNGGKPEQITGLIRPNNWSDGNYVQPKTEGLLGQIFGLPTKFDLRTKTPHGLPPVRNQGQCGSCWDFATTAVLDDLLYLKWNGDHDPHLAQQTMLSCYKGGDCNGGYFNAFDYLRDKGLHWSSQDPYLASGSSCKYIPFHGRISSWSYLGANGRSPTNDEIKNALLQHGPVAVDIFANNNFMSYQGGVYDVCESGQTNHMVVIEGYDDSDGVGYWIVRNSWGESWGESGYFRIRYGCNSIATAAAIATL